MPIVPYPLVTQFKNAENKGGRGATNVFKKKIQHWHKQFTNDHFDFYLDYFPTKLQWVFLRSLYYYILQNHLSPTLRYIRTMLLSSESEDTGQQTCCPISICFRSCTHHQTHDQRYCQHLLLFHLISIQTASSSQIFSTQVCQNGWFDGRGTSCVATNHNLMLVSIWRLEGVGIIPQLQAISSWTTLILLAEIQLLQIMTLVDVPYAFK